VDAENKLEACKLLDKHVELLDPSHRERSINLSVELKTQVSYINSKKKKKKKKFFFF